MLLGKQDEPVSILNANDQTNPVSVLNANDQTNPVVKSGAHKSV